MIRHIVIWRLKEKADGRSKDQNSLRIKEALESLPGKVPGIVRIEVGLDIGYAVGNDDIVLVVDFEDENALGTYQSHPEHVKVAKMLGELRETRSVVDYRVE